MDVFLVPVGTDRYELYCEEQEAPEGVAEAAPGGFFQRVRRRFSDMLAEAERERQSGSDSGPSPGWLGRVQVKTMRWMAESIAEQRLLWHLRRQTEATLVYPDDLDAPRAAEILRKQLGRDFDKHRFWLIIDSLGFALSGLLMLVPGPNVLAYYFGFRLVGHFFSMRGARQGLTGATWRHVASAPLSALRRALHLEPDQREQHVLDVAVELRLEHLATFFARTAMPTS